MRQVDEASIVGVVVVHLILAHTEQEVRVIGRAILPCPAQSAPTASRPPWVVEAGIFDGLVTPVQVGA